MTSMKIVQFSRPVHPTFPSTFKILPPSWPWTSNFKRTPLPLPLKIIIIINHLKENIIQGWLLDVIMSILYVEFRFQYQLINLVWPSFDLFSFSWSLTICFLVALCSLCVQLSKNITKCLSFIIINIFST